MMTTLHNCALITCVVFDFDGTLVNSNQIKRDTFYSVVAHIEHGREIMDQIFTLPDPGDRYAIFAQFVKESGLPSNNATRLARQYAKQCEDLISSAPEMLGAQATLETLHANGLKLFINSATPQKDLQPIVHRRKLDSVLQASLGGPASKIENLKLIMKQVGIGPEELMVVGDGEDDRMSAHAANCLFVPVFEGRMGPAPLDNLQDLSKLPQLLDLNP